MNTMNTRNAFPSSRIESFQALRFFGAMCVTVYHFTGLQGNCPFDFSNAVYLFYMISGFVVMLSTQTPEKKKYFLTRRLIRVLPLYWGLTVCTFAAGLLLPSVIGYRPEFPQLIKSLLFIPYARTTAKAGTAIRPIVGLGHTLQMEMLFYLFFLVSLHISHKYRGFIAAGFAAATALAGVLFPTKNPVIHFYTANSYVWVSFIIGMAVYGAYMLLKKQRNKQKTVLPWCAVAAAAAITVPSFIFKLSAWYSVFLFAVIFCAGLLWSVYGKKTPRALVKLGDISFSYYLLHYYPVTLCARALSVDTFSVRNLLLAAVISAACWGIAWVSWYIIENKLTGFLQKRMLRKP